MQNKECFKCHKILPIESFYKHGKMSGGRVGKCKECTKDDVRVHYHANFESKREYEQKRFQDPERKKKVMEYQRKRRTREPEKNLARQRLGYAVKTGKVQRLPCKCGDPKTQAHHHDYSKPLEVTWLCFKCHRLEHGQTNVTR